jgi:hypothetical protein
LILGEERFQATDPRQEKIFGMERSLAGYILAREDPRLGKIPCKKRPFARKALWQGKILTREDPVKGKIFGKRR